MPSLPMRNALSNRSFSAILVLALFALGCSGPGAILAGNVQALAQPMRLLPSRLSDPRRNDARLSVLWVGHATVLVQMDDKFILTDPIFTSEAGQVSSRLVEPGIAPENVPVVDAVLISHLHFDHLSIGSLDMLRSKIRRLFIPEQGLVYVPDLGFPATELRTWERTDADGLSITAVPVEHVGWRYGVDVGWMVKSFTGYVVQYHGLTVYFGGDTAYSKADFRETKRRFSSIDLALLPIAPIHPENIMKRRHMDPVDAVQAFLDLNARVMMPIHFDTFINSSDEPGEPERVLRQTIQQRGLTEKQVAILQIGEQRVILPRQEDSATIGATAPR